MRTTLTLDPDVAALIRKAMRARGGSLKDVVNDAIRRGLGTSNDTKPFRTRTFKMGHEPSIPFDKALRLAADLEDDEIARKIAARK